jgi:transposase
VESIPQDLLRINADDPQALTRLLDLPELRVVTVEQVAWRHQICLHCELVTDLAQCPACQHLSMAPHQYRTRTVRDLAWAGWRCYLQFTMRRFWCEYCRRPFTEPLEALAPHARTTRRYGAYLVGQCRDRSIQAVARSEQHGYRAVEGIYYRTAASQHPPTPPRPLIRRVGLDEIAARKGRGQYKLVVVDLDAGAVLEQLADRRKETVRTYLLGWSPPQRAAVEEVSVDFWAAYHEVAAELLPQARVVGDRFHVQKHLNEAVNTTRRTEQRRLPAADRGFVQERRGLVLGNEADLDATAWVDLAIIKEALPTLGRVHTLKEEFRTICEEAPDRASAGERLREWLGAVRASGVAALEKFGQFVERWWEPILNYFVNRTTNGLVEGLNNKIKLIKRRAFGFRNDDHFRLRVLMECDGST